MVLSVPVQRSATVALSLQENLHSQLDVTASNLANSTTSGFKKLFAESREAKYNLGTSGDLSYVTPVNIKRDFSAGALKQTRNTYDLAISGDGFFQIAGGKLTQNGQFQLDNQGKIVTPTGEPLLNDGGSELTIPLESKYVHISNNGTISNQNGAIGKVGLFTVTNKDNLQYTKDGYYISNEDLIPAANADIYQGFLMDSNVNAIEETIKLIEIQRRYEHAEKILKESYSLAKDVVNVSASTSM